MEILTNILRSDIFLIVLLVFIFILFILYIAILKNIMKLRSSYKKFMERLGNGNNVDEMLRAYIVAVQQVEKKNEKTALYCKELENNIANCIQKIGIVRYNAFSNTGSDLSFSIALLDKYNNGVVLNGVYGRDNSNIYAKPVNEGNSTYILSDEEKEAIQKAINKK